MKRPYLLRYGLLLPVIAVLAAMFLLSGTGSYVDAQSPTATPTLTDHESHHITPTPTPTTDMMGSMNMGGSNTDPMDGGGHDMNPIDPGNVPLAPKDAQGGQPLEFKLVNGVKEFNLTVQKVRWNILPEIEVVAYTYNGTVPGPEIRVTEGDKVRILVKNELDEGTSVHWHGVQVPNSQDGAAEVTQPPIKPGEMFTYEWTVPNTPGTFFYHTHFAADKQMTLGLYAPLIIESKTAQTSYDVEYTVLLGEWTIKEGKTYPAMELEGMLPNYFTINGHSFPSTDVINAKVGQKVLIRFIGSGQFAHPMHLHGQPFKIVATDGYPVPEAARLTKDTLLISPGERYDVEFTASAPGTWLLHCHILHHTTNDGQEVNGGGGIAMAISVAQ